MPTRYFKNSVDQNWDTLGNWWANAACDEGFSGTLTGVNVTDTDTEVTCDSTAGIVVGRPITGPGIDTGTTVASITDGTTFELSQAAISTETSNLTCELHVIPVTADDVVIATGNGPVAGTPSADVLGLVTVNGDSVLDVGMWPSVGLSAASFEFNDTSYNSGCIAGNCTFNDSSANFDGHFAGNCTFNDSSFNYGSITGDCTFNDTSSTTIYVTGNCTFNDSSFNNWGYIVGDCTFNGSSYNGSSSASITGDCTFNDSSYNDGTISGDCVFNGASYNFNSGNINGNASFNDTSYTTGTITGNPTFNDTSYTTGTITGDPTFYDSSYNNGGTITGDVTFYDSSYNTANTITGNGTIRQSAAAFTAWRNYATSTYITGTLTLQFPEMDILGTGLL